MSQSNVSQEERAPAAMPPPPQASPSGSGWTLGRIVAAVFSALMILISLGMLGAGVTGLWVNGTQRDAAGYVTTGVHDFSTAGSAITTRSVELDSPGVGWLYSSVLLGKVRVRVTPSSDGSPLFVGIGPKRQVDRYLAGVSQTEISDFWSNRVRVLGGGTFASSPATQDFWVASATGHDAQTVTWEPTNGSWTVVVMNADGRAGVDVGADLGATYPALAWIAVASVIVGLLFLVGGATLAAGVIRRVRGA